jgi:hypothetical protein
MFWIKEINNVTVKELKFNGDGFDSLALNIRASQFVTISNCVFENYTSLVNAVIMGYFSDSEQPTAHINVIGNVFRNCSAMCAEMASLIEPQISNIVISDNSFMNVGGIPNRKPIWIMNADGVDISHNYFNNSGAERGIQSAICVQDSRDVIISENTLIDATDALYDASIHVLRTVQFIISNNLIRFLTDRTGDTDGIICDINLLVGPHPRTANFTITGNVVRGGAVAHASVGIYLHGYASYDVQNATISSNQVNGWANGIVATDSINVAAIGNQVVSTNGLVFVAVKNFLIQGNLISATLGINSDGGSTSSGAIYSNNLKNCLEPLTIDVPTNNIHIKANLGFCTENSGSITISGAINYVTISHGLIGTPTCVIVTGNTTLIGDFCASNLTTTTFDIYFANAPGTDIWKFYWYAEV